MRGSLPVRCSKAFGQEDFGLQPQSAVDVCHQQVQKADLFSAWSVCVEAGSRLATPDRRSITEMEYDWAKAVAPRFLYVARRIFQSPATFGKATPSIDARSTSASESMSELVVSQDGFVSRRIGRHPTFLRAGLSMN